MDVLCLQSPRNAEAMKILHPTIPDVFDPEAVDISKLNGVNWKGIYEESAHTVCRSTPLAIIKLDYMYIIYTHAMYCFIISFTINVFRIKGKL